MWEAFEHAAHEGLDNLTAIIDVNRLGQRGETMHGWDLERFAEPRRGLRLARDRRSTATTSTPIDRAYARGGRDQRPAHGDRRPDPQGHGRRRGGGPGRRARQAAGDPERRSRSWAGRRPPGRRSRAAAGGDAARVRGRRARAARVRGRRRGRDPQGLRRGAGRARRARGPTSSRSTARWANSTYAEIFAERTPSASSRCTSPSSRWSAAAVGIQVRGWAPSPPASPPS